MCTWRAATFFIMPQTPRTPRRRRRCLLLLKILNSNWPVSKAIIYSRIYTTIYIKRTPTTRAGSISCILDRLLDPSSPHPSPTRHTKALPRAHSASTATPNINHSLLIFIYTYRHECRKILVPHASCMACFETSKIGGVRACVYAWVGGF